DWLELNAWASCDWVTPFDWRLVLSPSASFRRSSMYADSSSVRPRKSFASPTTHPLAARLRRLLARIVVLLQSLSAGIYDRLGCGPRLLGKDRHNHNGVRVDAVHQSPVSRRVINSQLVALRSDRGHGPRSWHADQLTLLQKPKQVAGLDATRSEERRVGKDRRSVLVTHAAQTDRLQS